MKIWRRGHIGLEHKSFLEANSIKHKPWYKVVMPPQPRPILDYLFLISEDDPAYPELKRRIGKEYLYVGTEFTDKEQLNAEWCIMRGVRDLQIADRKWIQNYYADQCSKCGAGWRQIAPFRIKKEPNLGKNQFISFGFFYLFCTPLVLDEFARQGISGFEARPVILDKENRPAESLKQLVVTTVAEPAIAEELVEHERYSRNDCPVCGQTWHVHYTRGMLPMRKEALKTNVDFQLTNEWFGSGANARREILASQKVVRLILEKKWKGVEFVPIQVGESLAVTDFETFDPTNKNMEISNEENEKLVSSICDSVGVALQKKEAVHDSHRLIYEIDHLVMEVNSGASFEQYFRWSRLEQIARIVSQLEIVGLTEVAQITGEAISVAYPDGLPSIPDDEVSLSNWNGSEEQEDQLSELAGQFTEYNGVITNKLADYARRIGV